MLHVVIPLVWPTSIFDLPLLQSTTLISFIVSVLIFCCWMDVASLPQVLDPVNSHIYSSMTLGHYLKQERYSQGFIRNYVVPMCAAVWSVPNARVSEGLVLVPGQGTPPQLGSLPQIYWAL